MTEKILSILIPAYNYKFGIIRLLEKFNNLSDVYKEGIEVIIFDDSEKDLLVASEINFYKKNGLDINYKKNKFPKGACFNWNLLLSTARGKYKWLLHHDEYPVNTSELIKTIFELIQKRKTKIFILPIKVKKRLFQRICLIKKINPPIYFIRKFIARPELLFFSNVFGPPSVMIVDSELCYRFDQRYIQLIDIEAYYSLFNKLSINEISFINSSKFSLESEIIDGSITSKIRKKIKLLHQEESKIFFSEHKIRFPSFIWILFTKIIYRIYKIINLRIRFV